MAIAHALDCRPVRLGALHWLALHALALWPHGAYLAQRALGSSDDPLGVVACWPARCWSYRNGTGCV